METQTDGKGELMIELNQIYNMDCLDLMAKMPDNFIDLTVTSPPYDNLRTYKGFTFDFEPIARELYRVTKNGGVVVWVVNDQTINGSESGTSFKQALYFKEIGFNLHDTMIWHKNTIPMKSNRYQSSFEYMFVLSKGKPITVNLLTVYNDSFGKLKRNTKGTEKNSPRSKKIEYIAKNKHKIIDNVWYIPLGLCVDRFAHEHPAIFPEKLANDHILSWSNEGDLVFDPFMGSGTTAKMALKNNRNFIGSEISSEYCEIANKRIENELSQQRIFA